MTVTAAKSAGACCANVTLSDHSEPPTDAAAISQTQEVPEDVKGKRRVQTLHTCLVFDQPALEKAVRPSQLVLSGEQ